MSCPICGEPYFSEEDDQKYVGSENDKLLTKVFQVLMNYYSDNNGMFFTLTPIEIADRIDKAKEQGVKILREIIASLEELEREGKVNIIREKDTMLYCSVNRQWIEKTHQICEHCKGEPELNTLGWRLVPMKTLEGFMICPNCRAVYRDGYLFGFYKAPKGSFAHIYALELATDGTTVPRLEFCDETITVEGELLNCILDHKSGIMHQSGLMIKGKWIKITWDLGQKKGMK